MYVFNDIVTVSTWPRHIEYWGRTGSRGSSCWSQCFAKTTDAGVEFDNYILCRRCLMTFVKMTVWMRWLIDFLDRNVWFSRWYCSWRLCCKLLENSRAVDSAHCQEIRIYGIITSLSPYYHDSQNKFDEAEQFARRSLAIKEDVLGPDHPKLALTLFNLANVLQGQVRLNANLSGQTKIRRQPWLTLGLGS